MVRQHEIEDILWFLESDLYFAAEHGLTICFTVKHDDAYKALTDAEKKQIEGSLKVLSTDETDFEE